MADAPLYRDADRVLTSARWDENLQKWIHDVVIWGPNGQPLFTASNPGQVALAQPLPPGSNKIGVVSVDNLPSTQQIRGTVSVDNLPGVQEIAGSVTVINDDTEPVPVQVTGSNVTQNVAITKNGSRLASDPVSGVKTVTGIAAELFAGAARKAGRCEMCIRNLEPAVRLRIGPSTVTDTTGFAVEPGAVAIVEFDPATATPIYAISEAGAIQVEVWEA